MRNKCRVQEISAECRMQSAELRWIFALAKINFIEF